MNNYVGNPVADHMRDMANEWNRTMGAGMTLSAVLGIIQTGAREIDKLQKTLTEVLSKLPNPPDFL